MRIAASSSLDSLALLDRWPKNFPKDVDSAKTTVSNTKAANLVFTLGANPTIQPEISAGQTSLEKVKNRWIVAAHEGTDVNEAVPPMESCFAVWKHVYDDEIHDRLGGCRFEPDHCPSALFEFEQIKTGVQVEITVFWSLNQTPSKRREFPIMWRRAKEHKSIYQNFLHQAVSSVSLDKLTPGRSWIMPGKKAHELREEELSTSKGSIYFKGATAERYSGRGELSSIVSTGCEVMMKTVVEGKVSLTATERISDLSSIFRDTTEDVQVRLCNRPLSAERSAELTPATHYIDNGFGPSGFRPTSKYYSSE